MEKTFEGLSGILIVVYFAIIFSIFVMEGMKIRFKGKMNIAITLVQNVYLVIAIVISLLMCSSEIEGSPDDNSQHFVGFLFMVMNLVMIFFVNSKEDKREKEDKLPALTITQRDIEEIVIDKKNERVGIRKIHEQTRQVTDMDFLLENLNAPR